MRQVHYHANLAALVAAWESYIESITTEALGLASRPLDIGYSAIHGNLKSRADNVIKRFNTPNWEKSRELLVQYVGFDPYNIWAWANGGLNAFQSKAFLDEILLVRHSFAHGFALPASVHWLTVVGSDRFLSGQSIDRADRFIKHLVGQTDVGVSRHLFTVFGVRTNW